MKFEFDINDRERTVEVQHQAHGYHIVVDGRERVVEAVRLGADTWSLIVQDVASGQLRSTEAVVVPQKGNGSVDVYIAGHRIPVTQRAGLGRRTRGDGAVHGGGAQRLVSPMPGKVVRVLVKPGDEVQPRQGLVVVEAMKMENELRAARPGRVREVFVTEGQSVEAGTALAVVE